jgi:N-ethylmaleimide reductase
VNRLLTPLDCKEFTFKNRVVMASVTRGRATNEKLVPTALMAKYYAQRASAGLIIAERTWVNTEGVGIPNVPGLFTDDQAAGWAEVTKAVRENGGKIFAQLAHCGPLANGSFLKRRRAVAASAVNPNAVIRTPKGRKPARIPRAMTIDDIHRTELEYTSASLNAQEAGFSGVEIDASGISLIPSFFHNATNKRTDEYGGSYKNRFDILFGIFIGVVNIWGPGRVGLKLSPSLIDGAYTPEEDVVSFYDFLIGELNQFPLAHLHLVKSPMPVDGTPFERIKDPAAYFRSRYKGRIITGGGFTKETAERALAENVADMVSFGTPFIANPDLVERFRQNAPLNEPDRSTIAQGGENGYTTYPTLGGDR